MHILPTLYHYTSFLTCILAIKCTMPLLNEQSDFQRYINLLGIQSIIQLKF